MLGYTILSFDLTAVLRSTLHDGKAARCMTGGPHAQYPPERTKYSVGAAILVHDMLGCACTPAVTQLSRNRELRFYFIMAFKAFRVSLPSSLRHRLGNIARRKLGARQIREYFASLWTFIKRVVPSAIGLNVVRSEAWIQLIIDLKEIALNVDFKRTIFEVTYSTLSKDASTEIWVMTPNFFLFSGRAISWLHLLRTSEHSVSGLFFYDQ